MIYNAPTIIIKLNIISELEMITAKPKTEKRICTIIPVPIPMLVNKEIFLPWHKLCLTIKKKSGPGLITPRRCTITMRVN